ncbi:MAG: lipocalin family protein [Brachymonas sp.]
MTGPCSKKHSLLLLAAAAAGAAAVVGLIGACAAQPAQPELPTVEHVILERYAGLWYEIARLPNRFQKQCAGNTTAEYTLTDKEVHVINSCTRADGRTESIEGKVRVVPGSGNAKLRVRFFGPFSAPYWILALDKDYEWALVGTPDRNYLWILARTPQLPQAVYQHIVERAAELGFATEKLQLTPQAAAVQYPRSYSTQF